MLKYPSDHPIFKIKIFAKLFNLDKLVVFIHKQVIKTEKKYFKWQYCFFDRGF